MGKSDTFEAFKAFRTSAEKPSGRSVKAPQSDNGGEYTSTAFERYLKEAGVQRRLTVPYSPQSNGVAERFNRTLMEAARCMLKASALPNNMWGEAVMNVTYVLTRVPHRALEARRRTSVGSDRRRRLVIFGRLDA